MTEIKKLAYWITEREKIRLQKEDGAPKPWSSDPVFQNTYFTNVDREDDKVTKWVRNNWAYDNGDYGLHVIAMIVARIFNLPSTLQLMGYPRGDLNAWLIEAQDKLREAQEKGNKIWNGAYIVSTNGKRMSKLDYCFSMFWPLVRYPHYTSIEGCPTLGSMHNRLMEIEGLASFLAAQVIADLKNSPCFPLYFAPDKKTFCAPGPGSLRGLSWFYGEKVTSRNFKPAIQNAYDMLYWELDDAILEKLCMQNLQNCFCEFDKYMRVSMGTGKSKRNYPGV